MFMSALTFYTLFSIGFDAGPAPTMEKKSVICTIMPVWALAREVSAGVDEIDVSLLLEASGGCPHDYALTTRDRKRLADAGLILANGLGLERFLTPAAVEGAKIVEVSAKCRTLKSNEGGHEEEHSHEGDVVNPHVWLSPAEAITMTQGIGDALAQFDEAHRDQYAKGVERAVKRLEAIKGEYEQTAARINKRNIVVPTDVFAYAARDLKLEIVASFDTHESAGISPRRLGEIIDTGKGKGVAAIFFDAGVSARVAGTISGESGIPKFELDTLVAVDRFPPKADWYEEQLRSNLHVMEKALGGN